MQAMAGRARVFDLHMGPCPYHRSSVIFLDVGKNAVDTKPRATKPEANAPGAHFRSSMKPGYSLLGDRSRPLAVRAFRTRRASDSRLCAEMESREAKKP